MSEIKAFYDNLALSTMLSYRIAGNARLRKIMHLVQPYLEEQSQILDIGCGIGLLSEFMARQAFRGRVYGVDLSPWAIDYARKTVTLPNVTFLVGDLLDGQAALAQQLEDLSFDLVLCADVLEHLPLTIHETLLTFLARCLAPEGMVIATYPHPEYTRWLQQYNPELLQPIDEVIQMPDALKMAALLGARILKYEEVGVWNRYDYIHLVMGRGTWSHQEISTKQPSLPQKLSEKLKQFYNIYKFVHLPLRDSRLSRQFLKKYFW